MTEEKFAFTMRLNPGMQEEYKRRHDAIWPDLSQAITSAGVRDYSIHLDPETNILFAVMWRRTDHDLEALWQISCRPIQIMNPSPGHWKLFFK